MKTRKRQNITSASRSTSATLLSFIGSKGPFSLSCQIIRLLSHLPSLTICKTYTLDGAAAPSISLVPAKNIKINQLFSFTIKIKFYCRKEKSEQASLLHNWKVRRKQQSELSRQKSIICHSNQIMLIRLNLSLSGTMFKGNICQLMQLHYARLLVTVETNKLSNQIAFLLRYKLADTIFSFFVFKRFLKKNWFPFLLTILIATCSLL